MVANSMAAAAVDQALLAPAKHEEPPGRLVKVASLSWFPSSSRTTRPSAPPATPDAAGLPTPQKPYLGKTAPLVAGAGALLFIIISPLMSDAQSYPASDP